MALFSWTIHIDAPPEAVFDELADVASHQTWANPNAKLRTFAVSEGSPAVGSKYRSEQVFFGKANTADIEIVAFERPRRFAYSVSQRAEGKTKDAHLTHTFTLTPEDEGTNLVRDTTGEGNPLLGQIASVLAYPAIKKDGRTSLGNLKAKIEAARGA